MIVALSTTAPEPGRLRSTEAAARVPLALAFVSSPSPERVAIVPCPPALLPGATGRAPVPEVERLRERCREAVGWLRDGHDGPLLALCAGPAAQLPPGAPLTARAFGLGTADVGFAPRVPGLLVARDLLGDRPFHGVQADDIERGLLMTRGLGCRRVLVLGGGSACRRDGAPGHLDERAVPYDDDLAQKIAAADAVGLREPDLPLARELLADLPAPLAVASRLIDDPVSLRGSLDGYDAPYGVAYLIARWWTGA